MKIKLFCILMLLVCLGCAKDEISMTGDIRGKVTDVFSGEPLQSANVTLSPSGLSTTTGTTGIFEFKNIDAGQYEISVSKSGYMTNTKAITVSTSGVASGDIALESDKDIELSVTSLNFGISNTSLSFEIRNLGSVRCSWNISGLDNIDWLEVNPPTGTLEAGKSNAVKVSLLRDKLNENKETTILINTDRESIALKITAEAEIKSSKIGLSTNSLNFGSSYQTLTFDVKNIGNAGLVNWNISGIDVDWINITPKSGTTEMGKSSVVKVDLDRNKLIENSTTNIIVNAEGESLPVTITAEVAAIRTWASHPEQIAFETNSESTLKLYSYNGETDYTLTIRGNGSWLKLSKSSGTIPEYKDGDNSTIETISLTVDRTGLTSGTYECELVAQSDLGEIQIPVTMIVSVSEPTPTAPTTTGEIISCDADLEFTLQSCTISGSTATITYMVKNIGYNDVVFGEMRSPSKSSNSYIYDDLGNQYNDAILSIGSNQGTNVKNTIQSGVSMKCSIIINNVDEKASSFSSIGLFIYNNYTDIDEQYLYLKNVAIEGRSKYTDSGETVSGEIITCDSDLDFKLTAVDVVGTTVKISYKVTNTSNADIKFGELRSPALTANSYVYDDLGNQYTNVSLTVGNSSGNNITVVIPSGASANGEIAVKDVAANATQFTTIGLFIYNVYTGIEEKYLYLKNVKFK